LEDGTSHSWKLGLLHAHLVGDISGGRPLSNINLLSIASNCQRFFWNVECRLQEKDHPILRVASTAGNQREKLTRLLLSTKDKDVLRMVAEEMQGLFDGERFEGYFYFETIREMALRGKKEAPNKDIPTVFEEVRSRLAGLGLDM
jgi:hypothetical protein